MIIGIDPSLTNSACVAGTSSRTYEKKCYGSLPSSQDLDQRVTRFSLLAERLAMWCAGRSPSLILIEGYSYGDGLRANHHALIEFGGILRLELFERCHACRFREIPPTQVKKFCCGNGQAKKEYMADAVYERFELAFATNDELDAWVLYRIGLMLAGLATPGPRYEAEVIDVLENPVSRVKKSRKAKRDARKRKPKTPGQGCLGF